MSVMVKMQHRRMYQLFQTGMVVSSTSPWGEVSLTNITENKIAYLEYDFDTSETLMSQL